MNTDAAIGDSEARAREHREQGPSEPDMNADGKPAERHDWSDLGARILSSLVLIPIGLGAVWAGGPWLAGAAGACVVAMAYEWSRMSEPKALTPAFLFSLVGGLGAVMFASRGAPGWGMGWLALCALLSAVRRRSVAGVIETAGGAIYVGAPAAVFLWLRDRGPEGFETVLALFAIIWSADVFAYFGGKLIGGPKIAEGLSPNKTWSGIATGAAAGACAGLVWALVLGATGAMLAAWAGVGLVIAFTGLMGDLFESFLKRRFGVKDASGFIPGHGGVLDRIDGLMAATLLTGLAAALWPGLLAALIGVGL